MHACMLSRRRLIEQLPELTDLPCCNGLQALPTIVPCVVSMQLQMVQCSSAECAKLTAACGNSRSSPEAL